MHSVVSRLKPSRPSLPVHLCPQPSHTLFSFCKRFARSIRENSQDVKTNQFVLTQLRDKAGRRVCQKRQPMPPAPGCGVPRREPKIGELIPIPCSILLTGSPTTMERLNSCFPTALVCRNSPEVPF